MAGISQRRKRLSENLQPLDDESPRKKRRHKPRRWFLKSLFVLAALVWCIPYIIAYTPLRDAAFRYAFQQLNGTVECESLSLGWLSPVAVEGFSMSDAGGRSLVKVGRVETTRALWEFLRNPTDLGTVRVTRPMLSVTADDRTSDLEQFLAPLLQSSGEPGTPRDLRLEIFDGQLELRDQITGKTWNLERLAFAVSKRHDLPLPTEMSASGTINGGQRPAIFEIGMTADGPAAAAQTILLKTDAIPLDMFRCVVARVIGPVELTGQLQANGTLINRIDAGRQTQDFRGEITLQQLFLGGPALQGDQLRMQSIRIPCDLTANSERIELRSFAVESDVGKMTATGTLDIPQGPAANDVRAWLRGPLDASGNIDLAALFDKLPKTLALNPQTKVTGGQLVLNWTSTREGAAVIWHGRAKTENLAATNAGKPVALRAPLTVDMRVRDTVSGPSIESVTATAEFMNVKGSGNPDQLTIEGNFDLDAMTRELGQLIDLSAVQPAGKAQAKLGWQKDATGAFVATLDSVLDQFQLTLPGDLAMREPKLVISGRAGGAVTTTGTTRLDSGELKVEAPAAPGVRQLDQLVVKLRQAVSLPTGSGQAWTTALTTTQLPLEFRLQGELAAWQPRLAGFLPLSAYRLAGTADIAGQGEFSTARQLLSNLEGKVQPARIIGGGLFINEEQLQFSGKADLQPTLSQLAIAELTIRTGTIAAQLTDGQLAWPNGTLSARGTARYEANLDRLQLWFVDPQIPPAYRTAGGLVGSCVLSGTAENLQVQADNVISQLAVYDVPSLIKAAQSNQTPHPLWAEQQLKLATRASYDGARDTLQCDTLELISQALAMRAQGKLEQATGKQPMVALAGKMDYDWQTLSPLLKPYTGEGIRIAGRRSSDFTVSGPLRMSSDPAVVAAGLNAQITPTKSDAFAMLQPVSAGMTVGWDELTAYGFNIPRNEMNLQLQQGMLGLAKPLVIAQDEGKITLAPQMRLTPGPMQLLVPRGPMIEKFRISPEMSKYWLKYVTPILADATQIDGRFSLEVSEDARMPVNQPLLTEVAGRVTMHGLQVSPGEGAKTWVLLAKQIKAIMDKQLPPTSLDREIVLMRMPEQAIDFRMQDGKVFHQGLVMEVDNVVIQTQGVVGIEDQSLGMLVEIPLRPEWIQKVPALGKLPDQKIRLNMGGTLDKPRINSEEIRQLAMSVIQNVAQEKVFNAVQGKVGEELNGVQQKVDQGLNGLQQKLDGAINKQFNKLFER